MYRSARMMMMTACLCCAVPASVAAQPDIRASEWSQGTTLNGFVGVTADSAQGGPALGGAMGWELTPNIALEGSGAWAEFGHGTSSFAGALKLRLRVAGQRKVDPFVQAGIGLYRATFADGDTAVPGFYERRMTAPVVGQRVRRTFTDPTLVAGGGVSVFVNRHFALRPDVEAAFVIRDGRTHVVTTAAVHAVYHFESHPVTPARPR
jgi:hypothetical protein